MSARLRARIFPGDGDTRHGTYNGYSNLRCWCEPCRVANADYVRTRKAQRPRLAADDPRHGSANGYGNWGCRCRPCTDAHSAMTVHRARQRRTAGRSQPPRTFPGPRA